MKTENKPNYKLESFEGPLDLLLYLIKKHEINIYDIPIAEITSQYINYLESSAPFHLENSSEFYLMASNLLYIKSRMLLPVEVDFDDDFEDPRKELVDQLIEYQRFKKLTRLMEDQSRQGGIVVERTKKPYLELEDEPVWQKMELRDLVESFSRIIASIRNEKVVNLYEEVSVNEKITLMSELLETEEEINLKDLIINTSSFLEIICAFLAILEMGKTGEICIYQSRLFGEILIKRVIEEDVHVNRQ